MKQRAKKTPKSKSGRTTKPRAKLSPTKRATKEVKVGKAKGRPMLAWVGKRPLDRVTAFPAQLVETYNPTVQKDGWQNLLFHGDNKEVVAWLLANGFRGEVDLVYIDPPFDSGADYVRKVQLRGSTDEARLEGEPYTLGEQMQYTDIWVNDAYLQFMYERLLLLKELLTDNGVLVLHCDWNVVHLLRVVMDEVFLAQNVINEIVWQHAVIGAGRGIYRRLPKAHETLLCYCRGGNYTFNTEEPDVRVPYKERITENLTKDENGYYYTRGRTGTDNPWSRDPKYLKTYVDIEKGKLVHDVWDDITTYRAQGDEYVGYRTQKPEKLISRVVTLFSNPGDLVVDSFVGSGTTAAVAQKLGRRWISADINKGAIQSTTKRLQKIIESQLKEKESDKQAKLIETEKVEEPPKPVSLSFSVFRVNDYDLQIQHNEAVNLACEHVGVERTTTDRYFEGKLGKRLVKITPFNHPLSPLDLEELKNELKSRPEEDRDITVIALGKESACDAWLEAWNRMRRQGSVPNQIEIIELRTDPKFGKFFVHKPANAEVKIARQKGTISVDITDFLSPTIIERLSAQEGVLKAQITDWRSMVDSVMIDTAYDGQTFNIVLSDVPEERTDLVRGHYEIEASAPGSTIAVKITDMLGEEVLITRKT